jgi:hypothetical protein
MSGKEIIVGKKAQTESRIKEIVVFQQVLIKLGLEHIIENIKVLVEVLNEYGFRSSYGKPYTYMSYRQMMDRADQKMIRDFISEIQHEPVAVLLPF